MAWIRLHDGGSKGPSRYCNLDAVALIDYDPRNKPRAVLTTVLGEVIVREGLEALEIAQVMRCRFGEVVPYQDA